MKTRLHDSVPGIRLAAAIMFALAMPAVPAVAQTPTETKIRLIADALRARDAGELEHAHEIAGQLLAMQPNDPNARRMLREIEALIAARDEEARNPRPLPMQDVAIPEPEAAPEPRRETVETAAGAPDAGGSDPQADPEAMAGAEAKRVAALLGEIPRQRGRARRLIVAGRYDEAIAVLETAIASLPPGPLTKTTVAELEEERRVVEAKRAAEAKKRKRAAVDSARRGEAEPDRDESAEARATGREANEMARLAARARSQYLAGDSESALETFRAVEKLDPDNAEARQFLSRIARERAEAAALDREKTRVRLMEEVTKSWQRPDPFQERGREADVSPGVATLEKKLQEIVLPSVSFTRTEIGQVVAALSAISAEFDTADAASRGVNIVLIDPANGKPAVSLTLRDASLRRVLDFVTESIGYQYEVQADAVVLRPCGEGSSLDTAFFPVARPTVLRMTGAATPAAVARVDRSFAAGGPGDAAAPLGNLGPAIQSFLQQAGVNFEAVPGASLAYDGSALIVTQTPRNLGRIRNILARYNDVRQVEIEAKFIEVQEGALEELGVNWTIATKETQRNAGVQAAYRTSGRSLVGAFSSSTGNQQGRIVRPEGFIATPDGEVSISEPLDLPIVNHAPRIPGSADLAATANSLASVTGIIGEFDVNAIVRALSQQQGTDLLSAPKVTVLSGNQATITVAQEMRYPQSFGQTQSQVGTGNASGGGSAGVAITAGTPQEFTKRNVGVELKVTPTVEEDDYSISLDLNPKVTEFDGFVEYGGPSIAISGSTTVTVPSGFYQPIFSVRDISTRVTIWDGATLVMGGLTREEVKTVNDKVPILGDLPLIGRAFRSKGESAQKRNLLIFVTASLVNPGGSLKRPDARSVSANSLYRNPAPARLADAEERAKKSTGRN